MGGKSFDIGSLSGLLEEKEALTKTNLMLVRKFKETWNVSTYDAIVETHLLTERELTDILADYCRVTRLYAISEDDLNEDAFAKISFSKARHFSIFPMGTDPVRKEYKLVLGDPTTEGLIDFLESTVGDYQFSIYEKTAVQDAIVKYYPISYQLPSLSIRGKYEEK